MNISSKMHISNHKHSYSYTIIWGPFLKRDGSYIREKFNVKRCNECNYEKRLFTGDWETFGLKSFNNSLSDFFKDKHEKIAKKILVDLLKSNNNKRWSSWKTSLLKTFNYESIYHTITTLNELGILIIRYRKNNTRIEHHDIIHLYYNEEYTREIKTFINVAEPVLPFWAKDPFPKIKMVPTKPESIQIYKILTTQKHLYESDNIAVLENDAGQKIVSSIDSGLAYFRLIKCLYGLIDLIEKSKTESVKTFSQQIFSDTKVLTKNDIKKLKNLLGDTIVSSILRSNFEEILVSANFLWEFCGNIGNSNAFKEYIPIPREMIYDIALLSWNAPHLLIVENQELFYNIVKEQLLNRNDWGVLLSYGFLSSGEEMMIARASKYQLRNIFIWPDLDPYGFEIAKNIADKFAPYSNLRIFLYGFLENDFESLPVHKKMAPLDIQKVDQLLKMKLDPQIHRTLLKMKDTRLKGEQEIMIKSINKGTFENCILKTSIPLYV